MHWQALHLHFSLQGLDGVAKDAAVDGAFRPEGAQGHSTTAPLQSQTIDTVAHSQTGQSRFTDLETQHSFLVGNAGPPGNSRSKADTANSTHAKQPEGTQAKTSSALFSSSNLGQRHRAQSDKLANQQRLAATNLQSSGSQDSMTIRKEFDGAVDGSARQHAVPSQLADQNDLLIVMPSSIDRMPMVQASRGWRQGIRTFVAFEQEIDFATAPTVFKVCVTLVPHAVCACHFTV